MKTLNEMRAAQYDRYGPPDVLHTSTVPIPVPKPGEVLVRVHAASVAGGEVVGRSGRLRILTGRSFPKGTGIDFAGEVVGSDLPGFVVGDRVWGAVPHFPIGRIGSAAEFVAVSAGKLAHSPAGLDLVHAAALPGVGTTAITALRDKARLKPRERLLVRGASGGVGSVAVQLGRAFGAHVTALARAENLDFVRGLGADVALDCATTGPAELGTFDVILDTVGSRLGSYRRLLAPDGRMIAITVDGIGSALYILASTAFGSRRARFFRGGPGHELFAELAGYVESGDVRPVVDTVHPLADIAEAHRSLEAGGVRGKHVIRVT